MRSSIIFIMLVVCGGSGCTLAPTSPASREEPYPIVAGTLSLTLGGTRGVIASPGSATAGSKWLETTVTYTNVSDHSVWIDGYSEDSPFYGIETRADAASSWSDYGTGFCGTGARLLRIAPGASHSFQVELPERWANHQFRVSLDYRMTPDKWEYARAVSEGRRVGGLTGG